MQQVRRVRVVDPVAIGDRVVFEHGADNTGMIREIKPRRNKISRRASGGSKKEQVLAANVDQVMPVFSAAAPPPDWDLLDRMLAIGNPGAHDRSRCGDYPPTCQREESWPKATNHLGQWAAIHRPGVQSLYPTVWDDTRANIPISSTIEWQNRKVAPIGETGVYPSQDADVS